MAGSVMKPLIPGYVARGMAAIDTPIMKEVIRVSFYKDSFVGEARQQDTYVMAKLKYPNILIEDIPIPEEREVEENLGPVADDSPLEGAVDGNATFDVQIGQDPIELIEENGPEEIEEEAEEIEEEKQIELPKAKKTKKKRAASEEVGNVTSTTKVSRTGRQVVPSTLHGTIVPNRYSTIA